MDSLCWSNKGGGGGGGGDGSDANACPWTTHTLERRDPVCGAIPGSRWSRPVWNRTGPDSARELSNPWGSPDITVLEPRRRPIPWSSAFTVLEACLRLPHRGTRVARMRTISTGGSPSPIGQGRRSLAASHSGELQAGVQPRASSQGDLSGEVAGGTPFGMTANRLGDGPKPNHASQQSLGAFWVGYPSVLRRHRTARSFDAGGGLATSTTTGPRRPRVGTGVDRAGVGAGSWRRDARMVLLLGSGLRTATFGAGICTKIAQTG
jgi:hypothetical protein